MNSLLLFVFSLFSVSGWTTLAVPYPIEDGLEPGPTDALINKKRHFLIKRNTVDGFSLDNPLVLDLDSYTIDRKRHCNGNGLGSGDTKLKYLGVFNVPYTQISMHGLPMDQSLERDLTIGSTPANQRQAVHVWKKMVPHERPWTCYVVNDKHVTSFPLSIQTYDCYVGYRLDQAGRIRKVYGINPRSYSDLVFSESMFDVAHTTGGASLRTGVKWTVCPYGGLEPVHNQMVRISVQARQRLEQIFSEAPQGRYTCQGTLVPKDRAAALLVDDSYRVIYSTHKSVQPNQRTGERIEWTRTDTDTLKYYGLQDLSRRCVWNGPGLALMHSRTVQQPIGNGIRAIRQFYVIDKNRGEVVDFCGFYYHHLPVLEKSGGTRNSGANGRGMGPKQPGPGNLSPNAYKICPGQ